MYKTVLKTLMISCIVYGNCFAFADAVRSGADVFGRGSASWSPDAAFKAVDRVEVDIPCLDDKNTALWNTELPEDGKNEPFEIKGTGVDRTLLIKTGDIRPAFTTVRILIDGGTAAAGAAWARAKAENVVFMCRPDKDIRMTFHLLVRGRTAGTYQAGFSAAGGRWNLVVLPMSAFGLRTFSSVAGIGFRSVDGQPDATVEFKDFKAVRLPFSDSMWSRRVLSVSLNGAWKFATDPGEKGVAGKWFAKDFNDAGWDVISSGNSWEAQGYDHYGWGWYRCGVFLPDAVRGVPLKLSLGSIQSDDEVWFNGVRIGGISSEYKYDNMMQREYIVPPELIRPGETNSIAVRIWGGNLTFIGSKSGLVKGLFQLSADPYETLFSKAGTAEGAPCGSFDMSDAIRGMPFGIRVRFPEEIVNAGGADAGYIVEDMLGVKISGGNAPVKASGGAGEFLVNFNGEDSRSVYFSGRFRISFTVYGSDGAPLYCSGRVFDKLNFSARDSLCLPELKDTYEDTPYGKLKLVDVIDCSVPPEKEVHPFMQGGYDNRAARMTPGAFYRSDVESILGKRARTGGYGWFAYRIGRGKLKEHGMYLLRIEYPEDKPRFCPVEVQVGQNYSDIGWKNGVGPGDVYDDWPLSGKWEWFDTIVPMDGKTVGSGGTGSASSENGFWVYFMNKMRPGMYYAMWQGGPAVASMKLYEIDAVKNAPVIRRPEGARQRTLALDWERQPDHDPEDIIRYSKLMGYSAISPLILKWAFANYGEAIDGYDTMQIDPRDYWVHRDYARAKRRLRRIPG